MDIFRLLKKDHAEAKKLLKKISLTDEDGTRERKRLFRDLQKAVTAHSRAEKDVVYSAIEESDDYKLRVQGFGSADEHDVVDGLFDKISDLAPDDERWTSAFKLLRATLEHHIKEEESDVFSKMKKEFSRDDLAQMAEDFSREHRQYLEGYATERSLMREEEKLGLNI